MSQVLCVMDPKGLFARIMIDGQEYIFDSSKIQRSDPVGVNAALYEATTMLSRATHLKGLVFRIYSAVKAQLYKKYGDLSNRADCHVHLGTGEGKKPSDSHFKDIWLNAQPEYQEIRIIRDFLEDLTKNLTTTDVPRLRELAEESRIGVHQTSGAKPPQTRQPEWPGVRQPLGPTPTNADAPPPPPTQIPVR